MTAPFFGGNAYHALYDQLQKKRAAAQGTPASPPPSGPMMNASPYGAIPGITTGTFDPTNNLIGSTFLPNDPQVATLRNQLMTGPDRGQLAQQTFQQLTDATAPQYQQDLRTVGEKAAQYGRIGSGVTTSELGDVALQRQKYLGNLASQLSTQSAGQTLQDRLASLGALSGLDQQNYQNLESERGYQSGLSQQAFNNALSASGLTAPSSAALDIGAQYGQNAQNAYGGAGNFLQQLLLRYGGGQNAGGGTFGVDAGGANPYAGYA